MKNFARRFSLPSSRRFSRRQSQRTVYLAAVMGMVAGNLLANDSTNSATTNQKSTKSTVLFLNWGNVTKGNNHPSIDPSRVAPDGWKNIQGLQNGWNVVFKTNGHGLIPYQTPKGVRIEVEPPHKERMLLKSDQPWEQRLGNLSIIQEGNKWRCWYSTTLPKKKQEYGYQNQRVVETGGGAMCYAESTNGIDWMKPNLGIYSVDGSTNNNIVSFANFIASVFRDENGLPEERYKSFEFGKLPAEELAGKTGNMNTYCLYGLVSPDGYHWTSLKKPLIRHFCDTQNVGNWDPVLKKYVGYFRDHQGGRAISRAETEDFHSWPPPEPILVPGPEDGPSVDFYSNGYTTYPGNNSLRLLFAAMYHQDTDCVDVRLALSNEGRAYSWVSHKPIIPLGAKGEFDSATIYAVPNLLRRTDGKLVMPFEGGSQTHNDAFFYGFYDHYESRAAFGWAIWEDGRLAGIEAQEEGEFHTYSMRPTGNQIEINCRPLARGGKLTAEFVQNGKPVKGFTLDDCIPTEKDSLWTSLRWKGKADISELRDQKVQLRIALKKAKVFGYRIVGPKTASK